MMLSMSHTMLAMCTGTMARVWGVIFRRISAGSIVKVSSISTMMGMAPTASAAPAVAIQV
ncbi:hypothetical protein D3C72_1693170 [compost metagenome]